MLLPDELATLIEEELQSRRLSELRREREALSERYRSASPQAGSYLRSEEDRIAYVAARLPATYAAVSRVLEELPSDAPVASVWDVGAGPGTASWAACLHFPQIEQLCMTERDPYFLALARRWWERSGGKPCAWVCEDLETTISPFSCDLAILSYSWGELSDRHRPHALGAVWQAVHSYLAVIEPGTPRGYQRILEARDQLIAGGGYIVAPCPHARACPLSGGDWCHFSVRLPRSRFHRFLKGGALGYEDEKFSYLIVSKEPQGPRSPRVLRKPVKNKAGVELLLCAEEGLKKRVFPKRHPDAKRAGKVEWGEVWRGE